MTGGTCLVVMYHYVRDSAATPFPAIRALPPALFDRQLDWLQRDYQVIDLQELQAALDGRHVLPPNAALLTFDDGFADHYAAAFPALARRGLRGVFFVAGDACGPSPRMLAVHKMHFLLARLGADALARALLDEGHVDRAPIDGRQVRVFGADPWERPDDRAIKNLLLYDLPFDRSQAVLAALFARHIGDEAAFARHLYLSEGMIGEMAAAGMTFGYHTRSHRMLSRLPAAEQRGELEGGVELVRALTGQRDIPFCYPWGGAGTYTDETVALLADAGYSLAFNTVRRRVTIGTDRRYELPRLDTRDLPPYTGGEPDAPQVPVSSPGGDFHQLS